MSWTASSLPVRASATRAARYRRHLPDDAWARIARSLRTLETFPLAAVELAGRWKSARFVLGPWSWMILLYRYEESSDTVYVVAMHDGRSATSATAAQQ